MPLNSAGHYLGLFNSTTTNSSPIVVVEFDTFPNVEIGDPEYPHVGININSIKSAKDHPWNASLYDGKTANVTISYNASTKILNIWWDYGADSSFIPYYIDLATVLPEWVTIGFSGSTGHQVQRPVLKSWDFNSTLTVEEINGNNSKVIKVTVGLVVSLGTLAIGVILTLLIL